MRAKDRRLDSVDRANIYNARWVLGSGIFLEQAKKSLCGEKDSFDVGVKHFVPACFWVILKGCTPRDACVVYQNIEMVFVLAELGNQLIDASNVSAVGRYRDAFSVVLL